MVLTYDQRLELLKKAREAKKNKKLAKESASESISPSHDLQEQNEEPETPKKSRSKSVKPSQPPKGRTLELPPEPSQLPEFIDSEPEVEEQIIYKPKERRKKKIIRRVIMEASSDEEEVAVIEERVKAPKKEKPVKHEITPKADPEVKPNNPFFNF